jgi:hypothetical protein
MRRSISSLSWLAAATFALGCARAGARPTEVRKDFTAPRPEPEIEATLTVRLETAQTDRFALLRAEVFLDHQPVPLYGPPARTTLAAGAHELRVVLVYNSVPPGSRYRVGSRHAFTVANGETKEIVVRVIDDGNPRAFDAFAVTFDGVAGT